MTRQEKLKNRRTLRNVAIIFVCMLAVTLIGQFFISFSDKLERELNDSASDGIEETYREVGQLVTSVSESRINYLEMLGDYFEINSLTVEEYEDVVSNYQKLCNFTEFYMLNSNGNYKTLDGEEGFIDLGRSISKLSSGSDNSMIIDGSLPSKDEMVFYIVNLESPVNFNDYDFTSIAFGYDKQDLINKLQIEAYRGEAISFITYKNGKIICRLDETTDVSNVFTILQYTGLNSSEYVNTVNDFNNGKTDTLKIKFKEKYSGEYYFSYQSLEYQDWMLVSLIPVDAANGAMNTIRQQTSNAIGGVFASISFVMLVGIIIAFRNTVKNKDNLILQRNIVFDLVCNNLNEIYILFNSNTKEVEYISPNVEKLTGLSADDVFNDASCFNIKRKESTDSLNDLISRFVDKQLIDYSEDVYLSDKHGHDTMYSFNIYKQSNSLFGAIVLSDRTKENQIRQELQDALDGAKSANEAKSTFLSNVSHDMRTPMNAIIGFANLVEKDPSDSNKVLEYVSKIKLSSHHLLNLINEVLDFSKVEAGKTTLNLEPVNIETVVNSVDSIIRPQALEKDQKFNITFDYFKHCTVKADELRLSQILINVLSNSIKYTQTGGTIDFNVTSKKYHNFAQYQFTVKDNGIGMSEEFVKKIFDPFSREVNSTTNKIQGTGLGMSITKNLIDLMGGTITVDSKKDEGSTFVITLHFEIVEDFDSTKNISLADIKAQDYSISGLNILAAEDNALNTEIIKAMIEAEGAHIEVVENGRECLDKFVNSKENEYDVILMDVQMPIMNGHEATVNIRASSHPNAKSIPIIAMTANAFIDDINNSLKAGMNGHVSKPIDMNVLKKTIVECIDKKETS